MRIEEEVSTIICRMNPFDILSCVCVTAANWQDLTGDNQCVCNKFGEINVEGWHAACQKQLRLYVIQLLSDSFAIAAAGICLPVSLD